MLCQCGCGQTPKNSASRYMRGHQPKAKVRTKRIGYAVTSSGCWLWLGTAESDAKHKGYCKIRRDGKTQWAHIWHYEQKYGPVPEGKLLHHQCKNRRCVNPDHLRPTTSAEHAVLDGRNLLTPMNVRDIRELATLGHGPTELSKMFGVSIGMISHIITGRAWKNVPLYIWGMYSCPFCKNLLRPELLDVHVCFDTKKPDVCLIWQGQVGYADEDVN